MIGASKLTKEDAVKIREMFSQGVNKSQIAKNFVSEKGHKISREHVSRIIKGARWNIQNHSFLMKDDLLGSKTISTKFDTTLFETKISVLRMDAEVFYGFASYIDSNLFKVHQIWNRQYPDDRSLNNIHSEFVDSYL
jgi:hypothetical protein